MNEFYRELYYHIFGAMADAVDSLESQEPLAAKQILIRAMREAEERILCEEEKNAV